jgi:hypothetical protein
MTSCLFVDYFAVDIAMNLKDLQERGLHWLGIPVVW